MTFEKRENIRKWLQTKIKMTVTVFLIMALTVTVLALSASIPSYAVDYSDIDNHWAKSYIETLSNYEAISGYPDGSFKPNLTIRSEERRVGKDCR